MYERYIGSRYESKGWRVNCHGATEGLEDLGRDLVCEKGSDVQVVQAKYWASHKTIHEKHIFQLYGMTLMYAGGPGKGKNVRGVLFCTSQISDSPEAAEALDIQIVQFPAERDYAIHYGASGAPSTSRERTSPRPTRSSIDHEHRTAGAARSRAAAAGARRSAKSSAVSTSQHERLRAPWHRRRPTSTRARIGKKLRCSLRTSSAS